jgi:hypothetical protein
MLSVLTGGQYVQHGLETDNKTEQVVGLMETGGSIAAVVAQAKNIKGAGWVGAAINVADNTYQVVDAAKNGKNGKEVVTLARDKADDLLILAGTNLVTLGIAGNAANVYREGVVDSRKRTDAAYEKIEAIESTGQPVPESAKAELAAELARIKENDRGLDIKALKSTTPVSAGINVMNAAKEAADAIPAFLNNAKYNTTVFEPKVPKEQAVAPDGTPSMRGYNNLMVSASFNGAKDLSSDPKLAAMGIHNAQDPKWLREQALDKIKHTPLTEPGDLALPSGMLEELKTYQKNFNSFIDNKKTQEAKTPAVKPADASSIESVQEAAAAAVKGSVSLISHTVQQDSKPDALVIAVVNPAASSEQKAQEAATKDPIVKSGASLANLTDEKPKVVSPGASILTAARPKTTQTGMTA